MHDFSNRRKNRIQPSGFNLGNICFKKFVRGRGQSLFMLTGVLLLLFYQSRKKDRSKSAEQAPAHSGEDVSKYERKERDLPFNEGVIYRLKDSFPQMYLTLVSIVQGVSLGYLAAIVFFTNQKFGYVEWITTYSTLLLIMIMWQEYQIGSTVFRWIPTLLDTLFPFVLHVLQVFMISQIPHLETWLLAAALFCFVGIPAYLNMFIQAYREFDDNKNVLRALNKRHLVLITQANMIFQCGLFFVMWFLSQRFKDMASLSPLLATISACTWTIFFIRCAFYMNTIVKYNRFDKTKVQEKVSSLEAAFVERNWPEVISTIQILIKQAPKAVSSTLYSMEGIALREEGHWSLAEDAFQSALLLARHRQERLVILREYAVLLQTQKRWKALQSLIREALHLAPHHPQWLAMQQQTQVNLQGVPLSSQKVQSGMVRWETAEFRRPDGSKT